MLNIRTEESQKIYVGENGVLIVEEIYPEMQEVKISYKKGAAARWFKIIGQQDIIQLDTRVILRLGRFLSGRAETVELKFDAPRSVSIRGSWIK